MMEVICTSPTYVQLYKISNLKYFHSILLGLLLMIYFCVVQDVALKMYTVLLCRFSILKKSMAATNDYSNNQLIC